MIPFYFVILETRITATLQKVVIMYNLDTRSFCTGHRNSQSKGWLEMSSHMVLWQTEQHSENVRVLIFGITTAAMELGVCTVFQIITKRNHSMVAVISVILAWTFLLSSNTIYLCQGIKSPSELLTTCNGKLCVLEESKLINKTVIVVICTSSIFYNTLI